MGSATLLYPKLPGIMDAVSDPEQFARAVAAEGVGDTRVLDAVRAAPRASFVKLHGAHAFPEE